MGSFIDSFLALYRRLGLRLNHAMFIIASFVIGVISWMSHMVAKRYGPVAGVFLVVTLLLTVYRRLQNYAGWGTPPLPLKEILHPKLYDTGKAVRVICLSDTHNCLKPEHIKDLPDADVFIHCGDCTNLGTVEEFQKFNECLKAAAERYPYRVIIAGNHDLGLDPLTYEHNVSLLNREEQAKHAEGKTVGFFAARTLNKSKMSAATWLKEYREAVRKQLFPDATHYIENETITLSIPTKNGSNNNTVPLVIAASPVTELQKDACMQSFARNEVDQLACFQQTFSSVGKSQKVDIFMTHGPPRNVLDRTFFGKKVGSPTLAKFLVRLAKEKRCPQYHVFGHLHECRGVVPKGEMTGAEMLEGIDYNMKVDRETEAMVIPCTFINAASINMRHQLRPRRNAADPGYGVLFDVVKE